MTPKHIWGRRDFVKFGSLGLAGLNLAEFGHLPRARGAEAKERACILIWQMGGAPQQDMFDMKPDAPVEYRGVFKPISSNVPGLQVCEHMPRIAKVADKYCVIRSMTGRTAQHEPAQHWVLTGNAPLATLSFPSVGSVVAREKGAKNGLPPYIAIPGPHYSYGAGFLGGAYGPFAAGDPSDHGYRVRDVHIPTDVNWEEVSDRRLLIKQMDAHFLRDPGVAGTSGANEFRVLDDAYEKALTLMTSDRARKAFNVFEEPGATRDLYGRSPIGQGCLLARRLVEAGARFVQVHNGMNVWDTHQNNFGLLQNELLPQFDAAFSGLLIDLERRGMLDSTLVIATGEFGRTPKINAAGGRDHWPKVWSTVMAGAGVPGGAIIGASDSNAAEVKDSPVTVEDYTATVYERLGIDYTKEYQTPIGRPVRLSSGKHLRFSHRTG
ncbi:MAG: DUF1501 domain-containing protein [Acidobacteria bacterium]|nr:DUF1501 domain-containing protein [Acidobacteriota bacterium]